MVSWALAAALALTTGAVDVAPPDREQIMAVPPELHARLQTQVVDRGGTEYERMKRVLAFMSEDEHGLAMQYRDDATQTVAEAFLNRQANCVTYTMMFLALAQQAGLEAYPQEIDETLAWQQQDNIVYRTNHVNAGVRIGTRRYTVDVGSNFVIARHPAHRISRQRLLAQYYNNRAAMLMTQGRMPSALAHAQVAIELDPTYPITWSNTGVLRLHSGDAIGAERAYAAALELDPANSAALFNMVSLYQRTGNASKEILFRRRLEKVQRDDPFHQFLTAAEYERQGEAARAVKHYRRAIKLHGSEHRFYYGLARAYLLSDNRRRAQQALGHALALSKDDPTRAAYREMLDGLRQSP